MIFAYVILYFGFIYVDQRFFSIILGFTYKMLFVDLLVIICIEGIEGNLVIVSVIYDFVTLCNNNILFR